MTGTGSSMSITTTRPPTTSAARIPGHPAPEGRADSSAAVAAVRWWREVRTGAALREATERVRDAQERGARVVVDGWLWRVGIVSGELFKVPAAGR